MDINKALELNTTEGFVMHYYNHLANSKNPREAYEKTENDHRLYFQRPRYSGWDSFRTVKNRLLKNE